jgi:transcriptional antiterminator NusG
MAVDAKTMSDEGQNGDQDQPDDAQATPANEPLEASASAQAATTREGFDWYVLRVASNKENRVRDALERKVKIEQLEERINRILVPTTKEKRMRSGTARIYQRKLYPGYVFVEMRTEDDGRIAENVWFVVKETSGVGDFISSGGKPSPMPRHDVEKMLASMVAQEEAPTLANLNFKKGDSIKVTEGPFENFEGVVDEINAQRGTVRVIATIFGRETPIEIEYWQVEPV